MQLISLTSFTVLSTITYAYKRYNTWIIILGKQKTTDVSLHQLAVNSVDVIETERADIVSQLLRYHGGLTMLINKRIG